MYVRISLVIITLPISSDSEDTAVSQHDTGPIVGLALLNVVTIAVAAVVIIILVLKIRSKKLIHE